MPSGRKSPPRLSALELGRYIGITKSQVNNLVRENVLTREVEGDFVAPKAIKEYYQHKFLSDEEVDYQREKAMHERIDRQLAQLRLDQKEAKLFEAEKVRYVMTDMLTGLRSQLMAMGSKLAPLLAGKSVYEVETGINSEVESRLRELSEYDPDLFRDESNE